MIASAFVQDIAQRLRVVGIADAAQEAEELVRALLCLSKSAYLASPPELTPEQILQIEQQTARRIAGEPLHYIIGSLTFMNLRVTVGPGVLIPRPETELLVEEAIKGIKSGKWEVRSQKSEERSSEARKFGSSETERPELESGIRNPENNSSLFTHYALPFSNHSSRFSILDLCTGSGCIALSLAHAFPEADVCGVDVSPQALAYARRNAEYNAIRNVRFVEGDLFGPVMGQKFACITANPPYIRTMDIEHLQIEIRAHEPLAALDGGPDGLACYRRILAEAAVHLDSGGMLIMELGHDQADEITTLAAAHGFDDIRCIPDYAGVPRIFVGWV